MSTQGRAEATGGKIKELYLVTEGSCATCHKLWCEIIAADTRGTLGYSGSKNVCGGGKGGGEVLQGDGGGGGVEQHIGTAGITRGRDQRHLGDLEDHIHTHTYTQVHHRHHQCVNTTVTLHPAATGILLLSPSPLPRTISMISECVTFWQWAAVRAVT